MKPKEYTKEEIYQEIHRQTLQQAEALRLQNENEHELPFSEQIRLLTKAIPKEQNQKMKDFLIQELQDVERKMNATPETYLQVVEIKQILSSITWLEGKLNDPQEDKAKRTEEIKSLKEILLKKLSLSNSPKAEQMEYEVEQEFLKHKIQVLIKIVSNEKNPQDKEFYQKELTNLIHEKSIKSIAEMKKSPVNYEEEYERHMRMQGLAREMEKEKTFGKERQANPQEGAYLSKNQQRVALLSAMQRFQKEKENPQSKSQPESPTQGE